MADEKFIVFWWKWRDKKLKYIIVYGLFLNGLLIFSFLFLIGYYFRQSAFQDYISSVYYKIAIWSVFGIASGFYTFWMYEKKYKGLKEDWKES